MTRYPESRCAALTVAQRGSLMRMGGLSGALETPNTVSGGISRGMVSATTLCIINNAQQRMRHTYTHTPPSHPCPFTPLCLPLEHDGVSCEFSRTLLVLAHEVAAGASLSACYMPRHRLEVVHNVTHRL